MPRPRRHARTTRRERPTIDAALARLSSELRGTLVLHVDEGYDEARRVWNAAVDRRPAAIARCADATDVVRAVAFARSHGLAIAVRGGGHSFGGKSTCEGSLVIDCSPMERVEVDPVRRLACAGGPPLVVAQRVQRPGEGRETPNADAAVHSGGRLDRPGLA